MRISKNIISIYLIFMIILFFLIAVITDGFMESWRGFLELQLHPGRLINDFFALVGIGGTLLNASLVGLIGVVLIYTTGISFSGPTFAAIFTMMGFGLFGKTPLNILPIILGVTLSAHLVGKKLRDYMIIALFGTALGPLVSVLFLETGLMLWQGLILGVLGGIAAGFILPSLAVAMLHMHQGYSLYNMGLTCGFLGIFAASLLKAAGLPFENALAWYSEEILLLKLLVPFLSLVLIFTGFVKEKVRVFSSFWAIQKQSGRLPSDFADMESSGGAFLNAGLIGLAGSALVFIVGADFNGPVIGGLMTIMGFGAFGTHFRNSWSVVAGVAFSCLVFSKPLSD
ncbi:DUF1576 domain-containing protein, partial [Oceanispirochaeta sp.]|uniref:DUF1576 domain-containing protein n=1 Tax=Oceanispirochaeta sp. TaxID=2035350 RepID=UPI002609DCE8